ncbi:MAG: Mur ligase family protein, partial [Propionibacteriaceae bacterium]
MGVGPVKEWIAQANRNSDWSDATVVVCGLGMSGFASADTLVHAGATVIAVDGADSPANQEKQQLLEFFGGVVRLGTDATLTLPEGYDVDLVITSPGWRTDQPLLAQAAAAGIPIWGDIELAWRWMDPEHPIPWLAITGTNGKTTTTQMLESMLIEAGYKAAAVGNIGRPILEAIQDEVEYDVFAVELSSFQLHWTHSLSLHSAALLNIEPDHMEWYDGDMAAYARDKASIYE